MASTTLWTYADVVESLRDFSGASTDALTDRQIKRSILAAYRDFPNSHRWSYYFKQDWITTVASYNTGTISYDHTGGSSERLVALSGGTFPTWAARGIIVIDNYPYRVHTRVDSTNLKLSVNSNPGADITAGESYSLYRDAYTLPVDFGEMAGFDELSSSISPGRISAPSLLTDQRSSMSPAQPRSFAIYADPDYVGSMAVQFHPAPDDVYRFSYIYRRVPHPLKNIEYSTGTVSSSGTTITGVGTDWSGRFVGSVIRFCQSAISGEPPTGLVGERPFTEQRIITSVASTTSLSIDAALETAVSAKNYMISDPVDIEQGAMFTAFLREAEKQLAILQHRDDMPKIATTAYLAMRLAMEADNRVWRSDSYRWALGMGDYPPRNVAAGV